MAQINIGRFNQISMVTKDIDKTVSMFNDVLGIGPWEYTLGKRKINVRGKYSPYTVRLAHTMGLGPILLEVIQVVEGESVQTEWSKRHDVGIMDMTFRVDDLDKVQAQFEKAGWPKLSEVRFPNGIGFSYMDTDKDLGFIIQIGKAPPEDWPAWSKTKPW
ncbi:MAG: VOC family protein [Dehalococcoidales bacterium]|nr:VOC family protein [Dehalococcoidales bacterium]